MCFIYKTCRSLNGHVVPALVTSFLASAKHLDTAKSRSNAAPSEHSSGDLAQKTQRTTSELYSPDTRHQRCLSSCRKIVPLGGDKGGNVVLKTANKHPWGFFKTPEVTTGCWFGLIGPVGAL